MLEQSRSFRRRLIVTDSLFSMDGDFAPLAEIAELGARFDAMLLVDEAHATGVYGEHGRGLCEVLGAEEGVHVRVGTLSKALGSMGGFVAGRKSLVDWLTNRARSYVFSTAPPAAWCAAGAAALDIVASEPQRRAQLRERAKQLRAKLRQQGWNTGESESQIIPIYLGQPEPTMRMAAALFERGFFVPGIRPPSVPEGQSLLRISLSTAHTEAMTDELCDALREVIV
jgi:8-amino-7-oxononanoate synthase